MQGCRACRVTARIAVAACSHSLCDLTPLCALLGVCGLWVRSEISRRVDEARVKFEAWQYALNNTNTAKNSSFKQDTARE